MVNGKHHCFKSGKYQYQIVLDGKWQLDYDNPNSDQMVTVLIRNHYQPIDKKPS